MTDRESLLAAIKATPRDDLPRLVYADWLDENGTSDLDAATSEFIRASVAFKGKQKHPVGLNGMMAPAGYEWLNDNWHRLVPNLVRHTPVRNFFRTGRRLWTQVMAPIGRREQLRLTVVNLEFDNGWLGHAWWYIQSFGIGRWVYEVIKQDQPQANMDCHGTPAWEEREKRRAELSARREREAQDDLPGNIPEWYRLVGRTL